MSPEAQHPIEVINVDRTGPQQHIDKAPRKVQVACQRCRDKRIKCDGRTPKCSKCHNAGVECIDVDFRKGSNHPRAFLYDARARLEWLENVVRSNLPGFDLDAGPRKPGISAQRGPDDTTESSPLDQARTPITTRDARLIAGKRSLPPAGDENVLPVGRQSKRVALDLGMFSLNTGLPHTQYLGSSSGSLFADLLPFAGSQGGDASEPESENEDYRTEGLESPASAPYPLFSRLKEVLPSRTDCDRMVKLFYDCYHAEYPILHEPSFQNLIDGLYICANSTPSCPLQYNGWPSSIDVFSYNGIVAQVNKRDAIIIPVQTAATHLFLVLSIAAEINARKKRYPVDPGKFRSSALAVFRISLGEISIASIQSVLLFTLQNFLKWERGSIWVLQHVALAYAVHLGLHRNLPSSTGLPNVAAHMRRRTFFCLYVLDRFVSTTQGRPLGFSDDTLDLTLPNVLECRDTDEITVQEDQKYMLYSIRHFEWATLVSKIKHRLYRFVSSSASGDDPATLQLEIHTELDSLLNESTTAVENLQSAATHQFWTKVQIRYHFARGLLYQPSQLCPHPTTTAMRHCFDSAMKRIHLYRSLYEQDHLELSWPNTHGLYLAGATLLYCIWGSQDVRSNIAVQELSAAIRVCSSLLTLGSEYWPVARRGQRSFETLADSTIGFLVSQVTTGPSFPQSPALTSDTGGQEGSGTLPSDQTYWFDVESSLHSFLQNDQWSWEDPDAWDALRWTWEDNGNMGSTFNSPENAQNLQFSQAS